MKILEYSYLYFFSFLLRPLFLALSLFVPKVRMGLKERRSNPWNRLPQGANPVIIHCASGEFEYAKPLVRALKERFPKTPIGISYFSPTYRKNIENTPGVDFSFPSPWDDGITLERVYRRLAPQAVLFARTDVWPGMAFTLKRLGIPTFLFSATLTRKAQRLRNPLSRLVASLTLGSLNKIFCVSETDLELFRSLGLSNVEIGGDTRFDQVFHRLQTTRPPKGISTPWESTVICGSTWPEDEAVLVPLAASLKGKFKWIMAPHEPTIHHLQQVEGQVRAKGLTSCRYSEAGEFLDADVLLVDKTGILANLYSWGAIAFVGGSFRKTVHSVMEPLASGCLTFVGPLYQNNREAILFNQNPVTNPHEDGRISKFMAVTVVNDEGEFRERLAQAKTFKDLRLISKRIQELVRKQTGATERLVASLERIVL